MAAEYPVKYENGQHTPFAPGDTVEPTVLNLHALVQGGTGIQLTLLPNGRVRVTNLCCDEPCEPDWQDTSTVRCTNQNVEVFQEDGCGGTRWRDTGVPVEWTDTGTVRCTGVNVEAEQANQCGTLRWNDTGTPVAWEPNGPGECVSGTLRVPEINQCGDTRVRDTGEACGGEPEIPEAVLLGLGCCPMPAGNASLVALYLYADGTVAYDNTCQFVDPGPFYWVPPGQSGSDFELRYEHVSGNIIASPAWVMAPQTYAASSDGVPSPPNGTRAIFNLYYRAVGDTDPVGTLFAASIEIQARTGQDCI